MIEEAAAREIGLVWYYVGDLGLGRRDKWADSGLASL